LQSLHSINVETADEEAAVADSHVYDI